MKQHWPEWGGWLDVRTAALAVDIAQLLGVLPLVLLSKGLEALHNYARVVAVVHVDARGAHPRLNDG